MVSDHAGRYVEVDERGEVIGKRSAEGAPFEGRDGRLVRHQLTPDEARALEGAVMGYPEVAPQP